ncbi:MAG: efflux RND transporter permease subunit, partial [Polyangiales bacterium]
EVPPGPPVLQTLVAEVYGPDAESRRRLAAKVETLLRHTPGVVDVDTYREAPQPRARLRIDRDKAALHGIDVATIDQSLRLATRGLTAGLVHVPGDREAVPLRLELPRAERSHIDDLLRLRLPARASTGAPAPLVPLSEVVDVQHDVIDASRYHKNLMPVEYVLGDVAGAIESPAYAIFAITEALERLDRRTIDGGTGQVQVRHATRALRAAAPTVKWDGEWQITLEVFRDLGLAFGAVLLLIYMLMVGWFRSFLTPIIVMAAIPFSLVGILPAHAALGAFFTATSMIGFMAGAGIVVRNSIILVDFIELRLRQGMPLHEAVIEAGAVRFRPMMLTAMAVVVGAAVILADPIFQGLALALMAGEIASLFISRMAVPVLYFMAYRK